MLVGFKYKKGNMLYVNENSDSFVWELIRKAITKESIEKKYNYAIKQKKIDNIYYVFQQAKELFIESLKASDLVSPLYQFYSFSLLSKILILIKNKEKDIESLQQAHGLKIIVENRNIPLLNNIKVKIENNGTYDELLRIHNDINSLHGEEITLDTLISRIIDIASLSKTMYSAPLLSVHEIETHDEPYKGDGKDKNIIIYLNIGSRNRINGLVNEFPDVGFDKLVPKNQITSFDPPGKGFCYYYNSQEKPEIVIQTDIYNNKFLVAPIQLSNIKYVYTQYELLYATSFIASNLVRYYPDTWKIVNSNSTEFWIYNYLIKMANRTFPNYILNQLLLDEVVILPPGTSMYSYNE